MRNRIIGFFVIGIAALIGFIIFSFNRALNEIVNSICTHGIACPMVKTIDIQTNISFGIMAFVVLLGLYLIFFAKEERILKETIVKEQIAPKITKENYKGIIEKMDADERAVLEKVIEAEGTIFQSELVDKTGFTKVKITRLLDRLEGRHIIERKRRGMTNVVVLKK